MKNYSTIPKCSLSLKIIRIYSRSIRCYSYQAHHQTIYDLPKTECPFTAQKCVCTSPFHSIPHFILRVYNFIYLISTTSPFFLYRHLGRTHSFRVIYTKQLFFFSYTFVTTTPVILGYINTVMSDIERETVEKKALK